MTKNPWDLDWRRRESISKSPYFEPRCLAHCHAASHTCRSRTEVLKCKKLMHVISCKSHCTYCWTVQKERRGGQECFYSFISHSLSFLMTFLIDLAINEGLLASEWKEKYKWIEKRVLSSLFLLRPLACNLCCNL